MFDNQGSGDLIDSGYGPFGLERLCRETGGRFFRVRSGGAAGWELDPATGEVKAELLVKYAPDYVSDEQYQQLLSENKARMALYKAAQLPPLAGLGPNVQTSFPKQKDEAAPARIIKTAQQPAAERDQPLQDLYDTLSAGEADRAKLTSALASGVRFGDGTDAGRQSPARWLQHHARGAETRQKFRQCR